ncbi:MAG: O-methyltransferase [Haloarculaceae archaeon]
MSLLHTTAVDDLLSTLAAVDSPTAPSDDPVLVEMEARADREGFPTVGHEVGSVLRLLARLTGAEAVVEFGSGFGYSAYWVAPVVGPEGEVVLTEVDEGELDDAREYFERGGYADRARFELGDAVDLVGAYDGAVDLALLDHENHRYVEGFEAVREKVPVGGAVVADNVLHSSGDPGFDPADLDAVVRGGSPGGNAELAGIADYYRHVRGAEDFETAVLPVGEGLFVSVRVE